MVRASCRKCGRTIRVKIIKGQTTIYEAPIFCFWCRQQIKKQKMTVIIAEEIYGQQKIF